MQVTQCDRCGAIYKETIEGRVGLRVHKLHISGSSTHVDLCTDCRRSLYEWMKDGEKNESCMEGASGG